jgi:hypothetical protein
MTLTRLIIAVILTAVAPVAARASYLTPATAVADFTTPGTSVLEWAFPIEVLWQEIAPGRIKLHIEVQTKAATVDGVTYGPGTFTKGTASGSFIIWMGDNLTPNSAQFWWPPDAITETPPPDKNGQNLYGSCSRTTGVNATAISEGYTDLIPTVTTDANGIVVALNLKGLGKPLKALTAAYLINSGEIQIHCDAEYMTGQ